MSLFRSERLTIALRPEQVAVRHSGRRKREAIDQSFSREVSLAPGVALWENSMAALADGLQRSRQGRLSARVLLASRFARFAVLPWVESAQSEDAVNALALACLESQYGDMTGWTLRLDDGAYGAPRLACALESALLEALQTLFDSRQIACPSVEPYFVACWNRWYTEIGVGDALLAVVEADATVIASIKSGCWHSVRPLGAAQDSDALGGIISREALLQGFAEPPVCWVHAPARDQESLGTASDDMRMLIPASCCDIAAVASLAQTMALVGEML